MSLELTPADPVFHFFLQEIVLKLQSQLQKNARSLDFWRRIKAVFYQMNEINFYCELVAPRARVEKCQ